MYFPDENNSKIESEKRKIDTKKKIACIRQIFIYYTSIARKVLLRSIKGVLFKKMGYCSTLKMNRFFLFIIIFIPHILYIQ